MLDRVRAQVGRVATAAGSVVLAAGVVTDSVTGRGLLAAVAAAGVGLATHIKILIAPAEVRLPAVAIYAAPHAGYAAILVGERLAPGGAVSLLAQAGVVGAGLLAIWVVVGLATAGRASLRVVGFGAVLPAFVFIVIRSVVESGLVDSSSAFVAFFTLVVLAESAPRPRSVTP